MEKCLRFCYNPQSQYLRDHYRLGEKLGKGNFGEVCAARLRLKSHVYSKRIVGKEHDWQEKRATAADPTRAAASHSGSCDASSASSLEAADPARAATSRSGSTTGAPETPKPSSAVSDPSGIESLSTVARSRKSRAGLEVTEAVQRRANQDKKHYATSLVDWPYACKIIKKSRVDVTGILREIQFLDRSQHASVLLLVEHFETEKQIFVIMGRCYGDVEQVHLQHERKAPLRLIRKWAVQILDALAYVHSVGIVHRDVKLANMFMSSSSKDSDVVLGDFGFAESATKVAAKTKDICGTPLMLSPETFDGQPQQFPVDVWACGCCVYELVVGEHPFSNGKVQQTVKDHLAAKKEHVLQPVPFEDALRQSCTFQRTGTLGSHNLEITEIASAPSFNSATGGFRDRGDFTKVATRFSKNERFVERFEELAIAVTSPAVQVDYSSLRFSEMPELHGIVRKALMRDVARRPTADQLAGKNYAQLAAEKTDLAPAASGSTRSVAEMSRAQAAGEIPESAPAMRRVMPSSSGEAPCAPSAVQCEHHVATGVTLVAVA